MDYYCSKCNKKIYKINSISNTKPRFNGILHTSINETGLVLNWDKASDNETPQKGLNYNICLTDPENTFIISPMANPVSGYRSIAQRGALQDTSFIMDTTGMPYGSYKWMIQAVDGAYEGGEWSDKLSFTLSDNPVPNIEIISPANNAVNINFKIFIEI